MRDNSIKISGKIEGKFSFSHEFFKEKFYSFFLVSKRLSGFEDVVPVIVSERDLDINQDLNGKYVCVWGQIRTFYSRKDKTVKIFVFSQRITILDKEKSGNSVILFGSISGGTLYKIIKESKREIASFHLDVIRGSRRVDRIPCVTWGRNARYSNTLESGTKIKIVGRFQSRDCSQTEGESRADSTYEVSISRLEVMNE